MAAFDKVLSGIPALDRALDSIRMGDNVVWRVSVLEEFRRFAIPFVEQAKKDGRKIIYFRFAAHPELVPECPEVKRVIIPLSHRFETFTVEIHKVIEQEGKDAFYVFDCLSELQTAWATDLMMGNFFRVTCPFLFILDTVAFFPIIRGRHSFNAVNKIISTTQLFLDVYSDPDREDIYIRHVPAPSLPPGKGYCRSRPGRRADQPVLPGHGWLPADAGRTVCGLLGPLLQPGQSPA